MAEYRLAIKTTLDWYGCVTFSLQTAGLNVMLDAYIDRAANAAGPSPARSARDIAACDYLVIGHSHFDHLFGAETILANTKATLIGSYETVRVMEGLGVALDRMLPVAGGETIELEGATGRATVSVYPSQHSCVWSHSQMGQSDEVCIGDLGVTHQEQRERFAKLIEHLGTALDPLAVGHMMSTMAEHSDRGDGGALVLLFDLPDGRLLYQDTSGHWSGVLRDLRPDVACWLLPVEGTSTANPSKGHSLSSWRSRSTCCDRSR